MSNLENQRALEREDVNNMINQLRRVMKDIREMKPLLARAMTKEDLPQEFISPSTPVIGGLDPIDPNFTGSFVSGRGRTFSVGGTDKVINIGGARAGVLQFGGSQDDGSFCAGAGAVCLDADGITIDEGLSDPNYIKWQQSDGTLVSRITADFASADPPPDINALILESSTTASADGYIQIISKFVVIGTSAIVPGKSLFFYGASIFNNEGGDFDFQVKGDTDNYMIYGDASTDRVGIGTNSPAAKLDVNGAIKYAGMIKAVATKSADYTLTTDDEVVVFTATATATLPNDPPVGQTYRLICRAGTLTIDGDGSDTIKGETSQSITAGEDLIITYTATGVWE